jgi:hemolysin III
MADHSQRIAPVQPVPLDPHLERESGPDEPVISERFVARAVYGLITVLAVLQGFELHPPDAWRGAVTLFGTTLVVALIEVYAETIGMMLGRSSRLGRQDVAHMWHDAAPVMVGAQGPTVVLVLSALGLMSVETAIDIAQVIAFVTLFGYGWRIGQLLDRRWTRQLLSGLLLLAIGALLVGIKSAFH